MFNAWGVRAILIRSSAATDHRDLLLLFFNDNLACMLAGKAVLSYNIVYGVLKCLFFKQYINCTRMKTLRLNE